MEARNISSKVNFSKLFVVGMVEASGRYHFFPDTEATK